MTTRSSQLFSKLKDPGNLVVDKFVLWGVHLFYILM